MNEVADGNYRGISSPVPIRLSGGRDTGVYSGPSHAPVFEFGPVVIGMKCIEYSYQVEIPDPPRESSWWNAVKTVASAAADFVPVVGQIKGAYEAYKVITDPNATTAEKLIAAAGVMPYGKVLKYAAKGMDAVKGLKALSKACCFVAGTLVMTEDGLKPIEEIKVGDRVLSRDAVTGETALKEVTAINRRAERDIWEVNVVSTSLDGRDESQTFETTDDHPWRTAGSDWVPTKELRIGDAVQRENGEFARISLVSQAGRFAPTFNLEVADFHSYFVGDAGIWVHNGACDITARATTEAVPKLQRIHSVETLTKGSAKYNYDSVRKMSTDDIVKSLRPGSAEPLIVKADGRIFQGNTRILVLEERGFDVNSLTRVIRE